MLLRCSLDADAFGVSNGYSAVTVSYIIFIVINFQVYAILDSRIGDVKPYRAVCERFFFRIFFDRKDVVF